MAIKVGNIPAFDQYPTVGIGLSVPFQSTATSGSDSIFNINYTTAEQVKYNLINYFLTSKGERVFNPSFGSNVQAFLFEQNDPSSLEILKKSIEEDINLVFSVIELKEIKIIADEDYYSVTIQIFYSVFSSLNEFVEFNMPL
jgi:phage baseplate assembly protein W